MLSLAPLVASAALATSSGGTELRIAYWPGGDERGNAVVRTLQCAPPGGTLGTLAHVRGVCRRLFAMRAPFAPVPKDAACTQVYGGPEEARVVGTFRGRRIWAGFRRNEGCEISRWNRHAFLFPGTVGGGSAAARR